MGQNRDEEYPVSSDGENDDFDRTTIGRDMSGRGGIRSVHCDDKWVEKEKKSGQKEVRERRENVSKKVCESEEQ